MAQFRLFGRLCPRCRENDVHGSNGYCLSCHREYARSRPKYEPVTGIDLTCKDCGYSDLADNFPVDRKQENGRSARCFPCRRDAGLNAALKHETDGAHDRETYERALERQQGLCAICGSEAPVPRRLCADHDHSNGKPRGLLCDRCNWAIGLFNEDTVTLEYAIQYLQAWREVHDGAVQREPSPDAG